MIIKDITETIINHFKIYYHADNNKKACSEKSHF
jgi:hypothetical protein